MPQLDQFTYLTQFVWLCVFYMTFYVLLFNDGLPKMSRILKLRAYLVSQQKRREANLVQSGALELDAPQNFGQPVVSGVSNSVQLDNSTKNQDVIFRTLNSSISYLYSSVTGASKWCTISVESLNANQLKVLNKTYLRSVGEISLSQLVKYSALNTCAPLVFSSHSPVLLNTSQVWALRVQKCLLLLSGVNKKKKRKL